MNDIITAVQEGSYASAYGRGRKLIVRRPGRLVSYTAGTLTVDEGSFIKTYDEHHNLLHTEYKHHS